MELLRVKSLDVRYGESQVLWGIDLCLVKGEIVALVGANGAGKTTLLKTLTGLLHAANGSIEFEGSDITQVKAEKRTRAGIAMVPEGRRLFAGLTVLENLRIGAYVRSGAQALTAGVERIFGFFPELAEIRSRIAGDLSGGQQQMCAIGRALMSSPKLLLVDEMSLGLAPAVVDRLAIVLAQINREAGLTILLVEQDVELALEIGNRGYILDNGSILGQGTSDDLRTRVDIRETYMGIAAI